MNPIFNVRVYGILIENECVLVSDEIHFGRLITKFPGGGLQFGEGTHECVKREFMEELEIIVDVIDHFYTVDFFQPSAFDSTQQVISIYYTVNSTETDKVLFSKMKLQIDNADKILQTFRWIKIEDLTEVDFTFPIDKKVATLLIEKFKVQKRLPS